MSVVTFGEAMVLLLADGSAPLAHADRFRRQVAGAESNVATGLARLGHPVRWIGRVGADAFGSVVVGGLRREGIDVAYVATDAAAPTGVLIRDCHGSRPIEVAYYRSGSAGSRLGPDDLPRDAFRGCRLLHHTGITPVLSESACAASTAAVEQARSEGAVVSFDPNIRSRLMEPEQAAAILRPLAASADVVLASQDEAELLSGASGDAAASWFLERTASIVVLKRGAAGAWATDGTQVIDEPARQATVLDPVGAGDAFNVGFLSAHLRGEPLGAAMRTGSVVAASCVQVEGDTDGLPTPSQLDGLLAGMTEVRR